MGKIVDAFWKICLFRQGPQDVPASSTLMMLGMLAYATTSVFIGLLNLSPVAALLSGVFDMALVAAMTQLLLWIKDLGARFQQTFTALMGTGAILGLLALPLLYIQLQVGEQAALLPSVLILALVVWNLAVVGHILRHAMGAPFFVGLLLAVVFMYVSVSVMRSLFVTTG